MVDLRREFDSLINEFGGSLLLIKNDTTRRCKCIDSLYGVSPKKCSICLGTGYINVVEKITGRMAIASIPETLPRSIRDSDIGPISVSSKQFYVKYNVRPKKKDLIIKCEWNENRPVFDEYTQIYEVNESEPLFGDGGKLEYFIVYAESNPIESQTILHNIIDNASQISYYITVRC